MSRHSKNCTATTHFTYEEKRKAGHGTIKKRLGKDALIPFGYCCLSLNRAKDPLVSPSGYIYSKECIYENLLAQKQQIQQNKVAYEKYCERLEQQKQDEIIKKEEKELTAFLSTTRVIQGSNSANSESKDTTQQEIVQELAKAVDDTTREEQRKDLKRTSFWVPEFAPSADTRIEKPDEKTHDPMDASVPMKLKHLMPADFKWSTPGKDQEPKVMCALTHKDITHQKAVLLKPSGQVILEECLKDMVLPTMTCPLSGLKLRKKDIIFLQTGGTSYSAHSKVEAKKYRPSMT